MTTNKLPRGVLEIPKGTNTKINDCNDFESYSQNILDLVKSINNRGLKDSLKIKQELEDGYLHVMLTYTKESLSHKLEQDMWNNLFKKPISQYQELLKSKDKNEVYNAQIDFSLFLDESIGFYSKLLNLLSEKYGLGLLCTKIKSKQGEQLSTSDMNESDLRYLVQYCYVHLGDLLRYQGLYKQAKFYYECAVQIEPSSGHAYNQLAILESINIKNSHISMHNYSNMIQTLLYYDYACTCANPFPATRINLESILRRITDESVSELLTSGNKINESNCFFCISTSWLHVYAETRLRNNYQRCRQLQQRIVEWIYELYRYSYISTKNLKTVIYIMALQCGLISNYLDQQDSADTKMWCTNLQKFSQDMLNSICRGVSSICRDKVKLNDVFKNSEFVGPITIFLCWISQYLTNKDLPKHSSSPIKIPFGEEFVKLLNTLLKESDVLSMVKEEKQIRFPQSLIELELIKGYQPMKVPYIKYNIFSHKSTKNIKNYSGNEKQSDERILFILTICKQIANKWKGQIILYNDSEKQFYSVSPETDCTINVDGKFNSKMDHSASRRPVNIALASLKNTQQKQKTSDLHLSVNQLRKSKEGAVTAADSKIAQCIQEHIALDDDKNSLVSQKTMISTDAQILPNGIGLAPAPGLILSSNLPPDFKNMTVITSASNLNAQNIGKSVHWTSMCDNSIENPFTSEKISDTKAELQCLGDSAKSDTSKLVNIKSYAHNPNREQFEKDLPPRFANKRSSQKENKGGFSSMTFWDSIDDKENPVCKYEPNLTKKESEILVPPLVPSSWLTDENPGQFQYGTSIDQLNLQYQVPTQDNEQKSNRYGSVIMNNESGSMSQWVDIDKTYEQNKFINTCTGNENINSQEKKQLSRQPPYQQFNISRQPHVGNTDGSSSTLLMSTSTNLQQHPSFGRSNQSAVMRNDGSLNHYEAPFCHNSNIILSSYVPAGRDANYQHLMSQQQQQQQRPVMPVGDMIISQNHGYSSNSAAINGARNDGLQPQYQNFSLQNTVTQFRQNNPLLNLLPGYINDMNVDNQR